MPELREGPGPPGGIRVREQLLRRVHAHAQGDRGRRHHGPARRLWHPGSHGRRKRRVGGAGSRRRGGAGRPGGRRAEIPRVQDLAPPRPRQGCPGKLPPARGSRAVAGARSPQRRARTVAPAGRLRRRDRRRRGDDHRADRSRGGERPGGAVPRPGHRARHGVRAVSAGGMLEFRQAIREAIIEEMERDESVVFFGEDVAAEQGGVFAVTPGIQERFGAERVFDTPISELAITGAAFGAAVTGLRPIIEIMFGDFMGLSMDSLINQSAKYWYLSNEQRSAPLVVRSAVGGGGRFGAIHSQTHATWFQSVPGLKIAFPSSPAEAKGLLKGAIRDDNPVIFLEHKRLYSVKGPPPADDEEVLPLGRARIARQGRDLTIVTIGKSVTDA